MEAEVGDWITLAESKRRVRAVDKFTVLRANEAAGTCAVELTVTIDGKEYVGHGSARRHPNDAWDSARGLAVAQGRAEVDVAEQYRLTTWAGAQIDLRDWCEQMSRLVAAWGESK